MNSLTVDGNSNNNLNDFVYEKKYAVERSVSDYYNATTTVSSALSTDDSYYGQSYYYDYYVNTNAILGNTSTAASATSVIGNQSAGAAGKYKFTNDPLRIFYYNIESKLSILPILLMIAGTLGNSLAFYVLTRKKLRTQSTMLYFAALTVMDTLSLYQWNFNFFYKYQVNQYNQNLEEQSLFLCRYVSFMAYFSMQTSAWLLTAISIDRYLIVTNLNWKQKYSRSLRFNLGVILAMVFSIALINLPVVFLNGNVKYPSDPRKRIRIECYTSSYVVFWQRFTLLLECLFPLLLMILFNYLLIKRTYKSSTKLIKGNKSRTRATPNQPINLTPSASNLAQKNFNRRMSVASNISGVDAKNNSYYEISSTFDSKQQSKSAATPTNNRFEPCCSSTNLTDCAKQTNNTNTTTATTQPNSDNKLIVPVHSFKITTLGAGSSPKSDENETKLSLYLRSKRQLEKDHEKFENMVNSISCSFSNLDFLQRKIIHGGSQKSHDAKAISGSPNNNTNSANKLYVSSNLRLNSQSLLNIGDSATQPSPSSYSNYSHRISFSEPRTPQTEATGVQTDHMDRGEVKRRRRFNSSRRNRRIVLMLSLLTLSFALSTVPSAVFYTFFRPIVNDKPYKRLLSMSFNLIRHLSHTFNFIIYFTFSTIIKQQLNEIFNQTKLSQLSFVCVCVTLFKYACCCCLFAFSPFSKYFNQSVKSNAQQGNSNNNELRAASSAPNLNDKSNNNDMNELVYETNFLTKNDDVFRIYSSSCRGGDGVGANECSILRQNSIISIDASIKSDEIVKKKSPTANENSPTLECNSNAGRLFRSSSNKERSHTKTTVVNMNNRAPNASNFNIPQLKLNSKKLKKNKPDWF